MHRSMRKSTGGDTWAAPMSGLGVRMTVCVDRLAAVGSPCLSDQLRWARDERIRNGSFRRRRDHNTLTHLSAELSLPRILVKILTCYFTSSSCTQITPARWWFIDRNKKTGIDRIGKGFSRLCFVQPWLEFSKDSTITPILLHLDSRHNVCSWDFENSPFRMGLLPKHWWFTVIGMVKDSGVCWVPSSWLVPSSSAAAGSLFSMKNSKINLYSTVSNGDWKE